MPVLMELSYEREDPFAVKLAFYGPVGVMARWHFSRDLLLGGMNGSAGEGEVKIWPSKESSVGSALFLRLGPEECHAVLAVLRSPVSHWLAHTFKTVPLGREMAEVDWDEERRQLFRSV
ncbi:SsgA family sporulation/cell division regulator [Streptomyces microflavus]|uniref:SsgA family sporulation/cell division regulator n=2 Tax=Streptomyces microflavus TaxID=1919 RepID=A0A7H8N0P5_STRMI|nr:SsgA family sporulation/cell division regulator [Streptomyces microflavus]QKW47972.1 SsgA family sporulation/cell division regulator [Streptomyces microflavus]